MKLKNLKSKLTKYEIDMKLEESLVNELLRVVRDVYMHIYNLLAIMVHESKV